MASPSAGTYYYWISRGVDNREVRANRLRKSVGAENTFSGDLTEFDAMAALITRSRSIPAAVSSRGDLEVLSITLLKNEMPARKPVRLLGVSLSSLLEVDGAEPQLDLPI